ncbi:single-stranded DNA-binding protein [Microbacterium sp. ZW T2_14]|uniref:single-stranded DNA-binding protein n=1 Tax=Microbacterium sp. ZW T2_14 TaxID=3378079 RepID=UPI00385531B3
MSDADDTITITGNVATLPELKQTSAGVTIATFRVASGRRRYNRETESWIDAGTNFYTVSAFRTLADHAYQSLQKGDRVLLTGRLRVREWENGTRRGTAIEIDADAIGHDLRWGTTTFVKDAGRAAGGGREVSQDAGADAWAAPGVDAASPPAEAQSLEPTLVGAGHDADASTDSALTPF